MTSTEKISFQEFLPASRRSGAPDSAKTTGGLAGAPRRSPPERTGGAVASPSEPPQVLLESSAILAFEAGEILTGKKFVSLSGRQEALATGRIGFGVIRNLTRRRGKADGPPPRFLAGGTAEGPSHAVSCRFLAWNPTEVRARRVSVFVGRATAGGDGDSALTL